MEISINLGLMGRQLGGFNITMKPTVIITNPKLEE